MRPDPRTIPRALKRRATQAAERAAGVDALRADLEDARAARRRTTDALRAAKQSRDTARARVRELEEELRAEKRARAAETDRAAGLGEAHRRLRAAALGHRSPRDLGPAPERAPEGDEQETLERELRWQHARAMFTRSLANGEGLAGAFTALIRRTHGIHQMVETRQVAQWLHDHGNDPQVGALATGLVAYRMGLRPFAWQRLSQLPTKMWLEHAPGEYVLLAGQHDVELAEQAVADALAHTGPVSAATWLSLTRRAMGLGVGDQCVALAERFDEAARAEIAAGGLTAAEESRLEVNRRWMSRWAPRVAAGPVTPSPATEGAVAIGVLGYDQPDPRNTSRNIGDYVQTVASLSHLVRHTGARFDDGELGRFATELAQRVPADLRIDSPDVPVTLHQIDRDAASYSEAPDGTWLLAFGWYAHKLGGVRYDFPFPRHLRPIYVSFHVNRRDMLTDEAIGHLRAHAPIGCRDHSTVDLLLGLDIPAFFSGCLTTTVRYVRPDDAPERPAGAPTVWIDLPAPKGGRRVRNERNDVRRSSMVDNLRTALASIDDYTSTYGTVVTGRLHSYLPARSVGCEVEFTPANPGDIRFAGLAPLDDDEVVEMGRGIADLLEPVMTAILAGEDEERVRSIWSEVTADRVAAARSRHEDEVDLPSLVDIDEAVAAIHAERLDVPRSEEGPVGEEMHVVLALDGNLKEQFLVVVDGLVEHASRPVHLHVLVREHEQADFDRAAALFPTVTFTWWPCDSVTYGEIHAMVPHITISTMDRLLLPELLVDVDRAVYVDIDALPMADLAELYETDLEGHPIGARDAEADKLQSGYTNIFVPAAFSGLAPGMGSELIRRETGRHPFDFVGFNAGVMVLDLARMRADRFCERFLPYAHNFGMHDQNIVNVYAGADRLSLDGAWNARPAQEDVVDPKIVHWAGGQKPWVDGYVSYKSAWYRHVDELARREAATESAPVNTSGPTRESL